MKKFFTFIALAVVAVAAMANELTVCDNSESAYGYLPVFGYWYDAEGMSQQIYPASMLTEMNGGKITELKFYTAANWGAGWEEYTVAFSGGEILLALKEVDQTAFDDEDPMIGGATVVATCEPEEGGLYLTFTLNEPFEYNGGNLLVEAYWDGTGTWGRTFFLGQEFDYKCAYYAYDYYGEWTETLENKLSQVTFTYEAGEVGPVDPPVDPTEKTGSPTFNGYTEDGIYAYFVEIIETEPSTIYYKIFIWDDEAGDWVAYGAEDWTEYTEILSFNSAGKYRIEAYAVAPGKLDSEPIAYEFVLSKITGVLEVVDSKQVANVRYFNLAGQEVQEANGLTIKVTTYTDGTSSAVKIVK